jgi:hypothetical protein
LGAVDYLPKPGVHDDLTSYGANLRKLVRGAAKARVSNFRRLHKRNDGEQPQVQTIKPARQKILAIIGAEGAHMDWFRLPLRELCSRGPVIGLQKLEDAFAHPFARFIEDETGIRTEHLSGFHGIAHGNFYLSTARHSAEFNFGPDKSLIEVCVAGSTGLDWESGVTQWVEGLARQARDAVSIYFLSAAGPLPGSLIANLLDWKVRQILPAPQSVVCSQMIDSIQPYAAHFPDLVLHASPDTLPEVL